MSNRQANNALLAIGLFIAVVGVAEWRARSIIPSELDRAFVTKPKDVLAAVDQLRGDLEVEPTIDWLLTVLDASNENWIVVDSKGIVRGWSRGAERLTGETRDAAVGYGLATIIPATDRPRHLDAFGAAHAHRTPRTGTATGQCMTSSGLVNVRVETWTLPRRYSAARITVVD